MRDAQQNRLEQYRDDLKGNPAMERRIRGLPAAGNDPMAAVCQYVLAPALGGFTLWLLYHTLKSGKQRLYFLARDGYLMSRAALLFCETLQLPLVCRYLSCSRYSLRIPFFHLDQGAALDAICRGGIHVTLDQILARAGLTEQERRLVAGALSLPWKAGDVIPYAKLQEVRRRLQQCERFLDSMDRHSRAAMPGLAGYLQQEGLLEEVPDAIVDSGWVGSMQMALNEVLASMGRTKPLEGYYWGLYALPPGADRGAYHCYDFAPDHGLTPKIFFNNCLFEAIFTAPHGMTTGYRRMGEQYLPHYGLSDAHRNAFVHRLERLMMPYIERLADETKETGLQPEAIARDRETIQRLLARFMTTPSKAEAECFGSLPFSDDVLEGGEQPLAAPLTEKELAENHLFHKLFALSGKTKKPVRESAWYEGSVVRCGKHIRYHLWQYTLYKWMRYSKKQMQTRRGKRRDRKHD